MKWWEVQFACAPWSADTVASVLQEWPEVQGVLYDGYVPGGPLHPEYGEWLADELARQQADVVTVKAYLPGWLPETDVQQRLSDTQREIEEILLDIMGPSALPRQISPQQYENLLASSVLADGASADGASADGASADGASADGASTDGASTDGASADGASADGASADGASTGGASADGTGPDQPNQLLVSAYTLIDEDAWSQVWEQEFQPIPVGGRLVIVPKGQKSSYVDEVRMPIYLDPGRAFGTGSHPTTQLCLQLLETQVQPTSKVLDVGCGTGVLSIAAVKLGAGEVTAVDVDPVAVVVSQENAEENEVAEDMTVLQSDLLTSVAATTYNLIMANILRDVVIRLATAVNERLKPGGVFIASGFLESDLPAVRVALEKEGLLLQRAVTKDDWTAVLAVKPA